MRRSDQLGSRCTRGHEYTKGINRIHLSGTMEGLDQNRSNKKHKQHQKQIKKQKKNQIYLPGVVGVPFENPSSERERESAKMVMEIS